MPIDFAAIAKLFGYALQREAARALVAQRAVLRPLERRRTAARGIELASRGIPIVRFFNEAVTMKVTRSQLHVLEPVAPPPSIAESFARGGMGFLQGIAAVAEPFSAASQETVVARFANAADRGLAEVVASVDRFERPTQEMFDPNRRTASDLFGLGALAVRALGEASQKGGQLEQLQKQLQGTLAIWNRPPSLGAEADPALAAQEPALGIVERLDTLAYTLLGVTGIVAVVPQLIVDLLDTVTLRARVWVLDELQGIERAALDLRAAIVTGAFTTLTGWAGSAMNIVGAVQDVVGANVEFMLRFWRVIGEDFAAAIRDYVISLADYFRDFISLMNALPAVLEAVTRFDLTELLRSKIGDWAGAIPAFSLSSLLDEDAMHVNVPLREILLEVIDAAEDAVRRAAALTFPASLLASDEIDYVLRQIPRARRLVRALFPGPSPSRFQLATTMFIPRIDLPAEAPELGLLPESPNLYATLFGGGRAERLRGLVDTLRTSVDFGLTEALHQTRDGLAELSTEFAAIAAGAADLRTDRRFERLATAATARAATLVGPEVERERERLRNRSADLLARAFESWLGRSGFELIGQAIPAYVAELAAYWREQVAQAEEPTAPITETSPHILRRRAALGRVVLPRLTLRGMPGRALDEQFADRVADVFAEAVRGAHVRGQIRLRELAAAGAP